MALRRVAARVCRTIRLLGLKAPSPPGWDDYLARVAAGRAVLAVLFLTLLLLALCVRMVMPSSD